jgi:histidinol phosphatase-like PHP family hydrolase
MKNNRGTYYIITIIFIILLLTSNSTSVSSIFINDDTSVIPTVKIRLNPYSVVYEGDIIECTITGNPDILYWTINDNKKHTEFVNDNPILFNPESTPLDDQYVNFTVFVENSMGSDSDTIPIILKKIFFGDIHVHTVFSDGRHWIDDIFENAISDNYLDFSTCTDHATMNYPRRINISTLIEKIRDMILAGDPWTYIKDRTNKYYDPGNFTTLLGYEWSGSNIFPGGYKFSSDGNEDVGHVIFYYKDIYPDAKKFTMTEKLTYDDIFEAMMDENNKGNLNIAFSHHPQGKLYLFSSSFVGLPHLNNHSFFDRIVFDFTTNFTFLANNIKNIEARNNIFRGIEIYSRWGTAIGPYSNLSISWPYYPDDPLLGAVGANKTDSWAENALWEWSKIGMENTQMVLQAGSDTHHTDRPGSAYLWRKKPAGLIAAYAVHNTREEIWDAMNTCNIYGSQLLKIRANVRFDDQMALGQWINCSSPLTINISAMSTFSGNDSNKKNMCPRNYSPSELDYPISDIWLVKKDTEQGRPWCKIINHVQPDSNIAFVTFTDPDVKPNDFYYIAIRQKGEELLPNQNEYTAFLGPVFINQVIKTI